MLVRGTGLELLVTLFIFVSLHVSNGQCKYSTLYPFQTQTTVSVVCIIQYKGLPILITIRMHSLTVQLPCNCFLSVSQSPANIFQAILLCRNCREQQYRYDTVLQLCLCVVHGTCASHAPTHFPKYNSVVYFCS